MSSNDDFASVMHAMDEQRRETREHLSGLRSAVTDMAKSVSDLTALVARVEERHLKHDDGMKRMGKQVDDHEARLRTVENNQIKNGGYAAGTWKVVTVVAAAVSVLIGFLASFVK